MVQVIRPDSEPEIGECVEDGLILTKRDVAEGAGEGGGEGETVSLRQAC